MEMPCRVCVRVGFARIGDMEEKTCREKFASL